MKELVEILKADGWMYFAIGTGTFIGPYFMSDLPKTGWYLAGAIISALTNGVVAVKAFRSKNREDIEKIGRLEEKLETKKTTNYGQ